MTSKCLTCPECGIEGNKISGQDTMWRFCREHGVYPVYWKCRGCFWEEQNKRKWPCHMCNDRSQHTVDGKDYPNREAEA